MNGVAPSSNPRGSHVRLLVVVGLLALVLVACAAGPNTEVGTPGSNGDVAGFWMGLWHGIIAPVTFIISLFDSDVNLYEVHNNGNFYDVGFVLGAGIFLGAGRSGGREAPVPGRRRDR